MRVLDEKLLPQVHVVEDHDGARDSKVRGFMLQGIRACGYASGEAFLLAWTPHMRGVVSMDIDLEPGMNGDRVFERLVLLRSHLPVVFHTDPYGHDVRMIVKLVAGRKSVDYFGRHEPPEKVEDRIKQFLAEEPALFDRSIKERALLQVLAIDLSNGEREALEGPLAGLSQGQYADILGLEMRNLELLARVAVEKIFGGRQTGFHDSRTPQEMGEQLCELARKHRNDAEGELSATDPELLDLTVRHQEALESCTRQFDAVAGDRSRAEPLRDRMHQLSLEHASELHERLQRSKAGPVDKMSASDRTLGQRKIAQQFGTELRAVIRNYGGNLNTVLAMLVAPLMVEMGATGDGKGHGQLKHFAAIEFARRLRLLDSGQHHALYLALSGKVTSDAVLALVDDALQLMGLDPRIKKGITGIAQLKKLLKTGGQQMQGFMLAELKDPGDEWVKDVLTWIGTRPDHAGFGDMPSPAGLPGPRQGFRTP
ncbi:MAG: hypothetical protein ABIN96_01015 [Rubrivivax sp.]